MKKIIENFEKTLFGHTPLNGSSWNPQNQYQPLGSIKDQHHKISKESIYWNKSYLAETKLSTDINADADDSIIHNTTAKFLRLYKKT